MADMEKEPQKTDKGEDVELGKVPEKDSKNGDEHEVVQHSDPVRDGKCYMICCQCELPCGPLTYPVQICSYVTVFAVLAGTIGGIVAGAVMSGDDGTLAPGQKNPDCSLSWAPSCLAGKVLVVAACFVAVAASIWFLYCCCTNCNGEEVDHRRGIVECYKCRAMLFVPPVALHFTCPHCLVPLSVTHEHPRPLPDEPDSVPHSPAVIGHRAVEVDKDREIIRAFILKADLSRDGTLSQEALDNLLKKTAGSSEQAAVASAVHGIQDKETVVEVKSPAGSGPDPKTPPAATSS